MWNWWEQPYLRFAKFVGHPFCAYEPLTPQIAMREIVLKRETWCMPPDYNEKTGEIEKLRYVRGIPGTVQHGVSWFFPVWRCESCKRVLIAGHFSDLRHECTEPDS
jgi:hypothetical protein